jgi:putative ABC transport system ATP-binding protein
MPDRPGQPAAVIQLRSVNRVYVTGSSSVRAMRDADLDVRVGDYIAVMGASGSGKSTLLNILGLLDRPSSGTVLVEGRETSTLPDAAVSAIRAKTIGFVFQSFHLLANRTALENVELPLIYAGTSPRSRRRLALDALAEVGLKLRAEHLPNELSGGERQRVAIARAMIRTPRVLLCDEPTGNLDSRSSGLVMSLLAKLNDAGTAIVLVTHDAAVGGHAKRHVHIADGIAEEAA